MKSCLAFTQQWLGARHATWQWKYEAWYTGPDVVHPERILDGKETVMMAWMSWPLPFVWHQGGATGSFWLSLGCCDHWGVNTWADPNLLLSFLSLPAPLPLSNAPSFNLWVRENRRNKGELEMTRLCQKLGQNLEGRWRVKRFKPRRF